ncbi:MAG TPA: NADH-quinone oxidoreductase subunit J [Terriglobales bacterium]|nr:NADH-quinone oxidoreductase subunit J [Terriglobales bacterium]
MTPYLFYTLAGLAIAGSTLVVTRRKPVHAALALLVTLLAIAGLYLMLYAPFVAGVQIALYAVAVTALFLFVIVLMNLLLNQPLKLQPPSHSVLRFAHRDYSRVWPVGLAAGCGLLASFTYALVKSRTLFPDRMVSPSGSNTQQITTLLYGENGRPGQYILSLEIASLLLLVTIIGAAIQVGSSRSVIAPLKKEEPRPSVEDRDERRITNH